MRPRNIRINVVSHENMVIESMEVKIVPREQSCEQTFRFYEPENTPSYLRLPSFVPFSLQGLTIVSSIAEVKASIDKNDGEIYLIT